MKVIFIKHFLPAFVFYTRKFIPDNCLGIAKCMCVFILPDCRNDKGVLVHELTHVWQFYRLPIIGSWLSLLSTKYRLKCEVEAYKKQLEYEPENIDAYAKLLYTKYDFNISVEEAKNLLKEE